MKLKGFIVIVFSTLAFTTQAIQPKQQFENETFFLSENINTDSLLHAVLSDTIPKPKPVSKRHKSSLRHVLSTLKAKEITVLSAAKDTLRPTPKDTIAHFVVPANLLPAKVDSLLLLGNPFFIDLVYTGLPVNNINQSTSDLRTLYYGQKAKTLDSGYKSDLKDTAANDVVIKLRNETRDQITQKNANFYVMTFQDLPDPDGNRSHYISRKTLTNLKLTDNGNHYRDRITVKVIPPSPWQYKALSQLQFSESAISKNWYQGGYSNLAVLGILSGQLTYDDKKCIQWDNTAEWRLGFNSVAGDTIHSLSTNDDVLKINSKLGIKAGGNFFYSGSVDFSTQFFNSYNGLNSTVLKTSFLTPIRLNIGVGLDYKYQKIFSLMLSPFSYKYIYVSDNVNVNPNLFGVKTGQKVLSEIGSAFKATFCYPVTKEVQVDSKLSFYTNYQKVEIDWEIVANMTINRFLSTRISFNPRYDNTVIMAQGQSAQIQYKQLLSVGFSHKFH
jgi:hypothetical protein